LVFETLKEGDCFCSRALIPTSLIKDKTNILRKYWEIKITEYFEKLREPHRTTIDNNLKQLMIFQNPKSILTIKRAEEEKRKKLKEIDEQELAEQADLLCTSQLSIVIQINILR